MNTRVNPHARQVRPRSDNVILTLVPAHTSPRVVPGRAGVLLGRNASSVFIEPADATSLARVCMIFPVSALMAGLAKFNCGVGSGDRAVFWDFRTIQPLLIVAVAGSFFASWGYASVATLLPLVQAFDVYWHTFLRS